MTVIRRSGCGEDGSANLKLNPIIEAQDILVVTESIWTRIELPDLDINANPRTGIATVPAWFWLELKANKSWWPGTDPAEGGQPFGVTVTIPLPGRAQVVTVLADAARISWDFGDGNNHKRYLTSAFVGKAYPLKSNVSHSYNGNREYLPKVILHYMPRYSWNGGPWVSLPDKYRENIAEGLVYRVREAQTILVPAAPAGHHPAE